LIILDHGLYQELSDEFRRDYCKFYKAVVVKDDEFLKSYCAKLGISNYKLYANMILMDNYDRISPTMPLMTNADDLLELQKQLNIIHKDIREEFFEILQYMPREMPFVMRNSSILRGINLELGSPVNRFYINAIVANRGLNLFTEKEKEEFMRTHSYLEYLKKKIIYYYNDFVFEWRLRLTVFWAYLTSQFYILYIKIFGEPPKDVLPNIEVE
jgi:aarF domain-containing kinase